jgi:hypothetical protein
MYKRLIVVLIIPTFNFYYQKNKEYEICSTLYSKEHPVLSGYILSEGAI